MILTFWNNSLKSKECHAVRAKVEFTPLLFLVQIQPEKQKARGRFQREGSGQIVHRELNVPDY